MNIEDYKLGTQWKAEVLSALSFTYRVCRIFND